jgi:alginate O-acetyltransferase complex protein AlgI
VRYAEIASQLRERESRIPDLAYGCGRFVVGLAKKVLIADTAALAADAIFRADAASLSTGAAWLGAVAYAVQIYFDFSGYSDMAIGLGRVLGFRFPENFLHPYGSRSLTEFWRRWHVSLSTWFRDYLYIPLGGNRRSPLRTALNLFLVFALCGLWHGAAWPFVVWGLYHGAFLAGERLFRHGTRSAEPALRSGRLAGWWSSLRSALTRAYTLLVVLFGWVVFRSTTLERALQHLAAMFGHHPAFDGEHSFVVFATNPVLAAVPAGCLLPVPWWDGRRLAESPESLRTVVGRWPAGWGVPATAATALTLVALLTLSLAKVLAGTYSPFIYYRF